jgi:NADH dehydrogenase FAD-containing subunit
LKELSHARAIRQRILECFEHASNPALTQAEKERLLHFAVVGGGPTSVEFAAELFDFISEDVRKWFPESKEFIKITLVEAGPVLLSAFDKTLSDYALKLFTNRSIKVLTGSAVKEVRKHELVLKDGTIIPCGIVVWSTGVSPGEFVTKSNWERDQRSGRIKIDGHLRVDTPGVLETESVFAIGDCSIDMNRPSPCTAQAAAQEATYLAKTLNNLLADEQKNRSLRQLSITKYKPFQFTNVGMLAYLGDWKGLADLKAANVQGKGWMAWLFWRSAYWTMNVSISNKILIPMYWFKSWLFGRDISRF